MQESTRIIPALAGNTPSASRILSAISDHPRSRGEYSVGGLLGLDNRGSSPLSRGILTAAVDLVHGPGIIPALAGNTVTGDPILGNPGDHPRSRGEYEVVVRQAVGEKGSSPLSRGILGHEEDDQGRGGIIPALAGNTRWVRGWDSSTTDHPRSRGEYPGLGTVTVILSGSSPLSRGIPRGAGAHANRIRIIPALAGNTGSQ